MLAAGENDALARGSSSLCGSKAFNLSRGLYERKLDLVKVESSSFADCQSLGRNMLTNAWHQLYLTEDASFFHHLSGTSNYNNMLQA